jgi:gliding motility-associated-like protein
MMKKGSFYLFICVWFLFSLPAAQAQLTAPGATGATETEYTTFPETDNIFIFCTENEVTEAGALQAQTSLEGTITFTWEQYNAETGDFEFYFSESTEAQTSAISSLENGGYRVTITQGETEIIHRAWVFSNWISASASVTESNCESFTLTGTFLSSPVIYYDLGTNAEIEVFKDLRVEWKQGETTVASVLTPQFFDPPTSDTEYSLRVYDRFGCETNASVMYESIVTKAKFSVDPQNGEAPLTVAFSNESENGDPGLYEWFFYRSLDDIKREAETTQQPIDSIMIVAYDDNPVYTYENSGTYNVKLVSKKVSEFHTCVDTFYIEDHIVVDTSFVAVPNVFTPNGDGVNDLFVVKFWSMKNIKISIFNRWGKRIHFWESSDVRGFEDTYTATVWDGRLGGGRFASPGVYYYIIEGRGRDDKSRKAHGFFHLFRGKD